jgi:hypothetical protein
MAKEHWTRIDGMENMPTAIDGLHTKLVRCLWTLMVKNLACLDAVGHAGRKQRLFAPSTAVGAMTDMMDAD